MGKLCSCPPVFQNLSMDFLTQTFEVFVDLTFFPDFLTILPPGNCFISTKIALSFTKQKFFAYSE